VNREQILALVWLRWRMRVHQLRRFGLEHSLILIALGVLCALLAATVFGGCFALGLVPRMGDSAQVVLLGWDGMVVGFLVCWAFALLADLQRSDAVSLDKLLHLPISPASAFAINFLGSLFNLTLLLGAAAMIGLGLGQLVAHGWPFLWLAPLLAAFLLMVTAATHQFQGWLFSLMANKRRRRMIVVLASIVLIVCAQAPAQVMRYWASDRADESQRLADQHLALSEALGAGQITPAEFEERSKALDAEANANADSLAVETLVEKARLANLCLPPGWLPLGAMAAVEGRPAASLACVFGMTLLGAVSLRRSYRTTLAIYTGKYTSTLSRRPATPAGAVGAGAAASAVAASQAAASAGAAPALPTILLERRLPLVSDEASVVAAATFRMLTRAPEVRMLFLSPLFMALVMGPMFVRTSLSVEARPMLPFTAMALTLMTMGQLVTNQFGLDRNGFVSCMLSGVGRREILLGKNLAIAPFTVGVGLAAAAAIEALRPMPLAALLGLPFQFVTMYLLFCLGANWLSIVAPANIPSGTFRQTKASGRTIATHLAFMIVLFPLAMLTSLIPQGVQLVAQAFGWNRLPIGLPLTIVECAVVVWAYARCLGRQGAMLHAREQEILATVKSRAES